MGLYTIPMASCGNPPIATLRLTIHKLAENCPKKGICGKNTIFKSFYSDGPTSSARLPNVK